jgi:ankyrin repeat protein
VQLLITRGADVIAAVRGDGNPLIAAARAGHLDVARLLLDSGVTVDAAVPGDENALIQASGAGELAMVQLLLSRGADPNARVAANESSGPELRTPLLMARRSGHDDVVAELVRAGARD